MRASIVLFAVVAVGMLSKAGKHYEEAHEILGLIMNHVRRIWQTILMKYHTLFLSNTRKDVAKFIVCCSRDWRFKG